MTQMFLNTCAFRKLFITKVQLQFQMYILDVHYTSTTSRNYPATQNYFSLINSFSLDIGFVLARLTGCSSLVTCYRLECGVFEGGK